MPYEVGKKYLTNSGKYGTRYEGNWIEITEVNLPDDMVKGFDRHGEPHTFRLIFAYDKRVLRAEHIHGEEWKDLTLEEYVE